MTVMVYNGGEAVVILLPPRSLCFIKNGGLIL